MDNPQLTRFFPLSAQTDPDILMAQQTMREQGHRLAVEINRLMPESPTKNEMLMRLLHLLRDVDLALTLDGVSRMRPMVVEN